MFTTTNIAAVSVINDLATDSRVNRICQTLVNKGYRVVLIGRRLPGSLPLPNWPFEALRMKLFFKQGPAFYLFFNLRLFFVLLFKKTDLLYSNDLDTLLPNYLVSKIKGVPLIYDSHELFCEVPELAHSRIKRNIWKWLERRIVPRLKHCITVNDSIATIFKSEYGVKFSVVRNIPDLPAAFVPKSRLALGIDPAKNMLLLQGAGINIDRGAEELVQAMTVVDNAVLYIIGGGDVWPTLQRLVAEKQLEHKVKLLGKLPKTDLMQYTFNADLGLSIDKDTNLNYRYSLPNKLFDYLHAGVPVLVSKLPELEKIVKQYEVGEVLTSHAPDEMAAAIDRMLRGNKLADYRHNTIKAAAELNWSSEKLQLEAVILAASGTAKTQ